MIIKSLSSSNFSYWLIGMPTDLSDNSNNLGHERRRKRIDDKISKSGGKRPRRIDKEIRKTYTSQYFPATQSTQLNPAPVAEVDQVRLRANSKENPSTINRPLSVISNLPSSSASNTGAAPRFVQAIRFLTPVNLNVPLHNANQCVIRRIT